MYFLVTSGTLEANVALCVSTLPRVSDVEGQGRVWIELVGVRPPLDVLVLDRPEALGVCPVPAQRAFVPLRVSLVRIVVEDHHGVTIGTALRFPPHGCVPLWGGLRFAQGFLLSQQDAGAASSWHLLREVEPESG